MQVKVIVGTIAMMLTMIVMGFVTLQEPARMEAYTAALRGRQIENGAGVFKNNCASCHGVEGKAAACFNTAGEQVGCAGRPLNHAPLVCDDTTKRMSELGWTGTKYDFLKSTVMVGRPWAGMPTWGQDYGGPLQTNDVEDVAQYIMNFESEELCSEPIIVIDWDAEAPNGFADLPAGDAANGEQLYQITYGCAACHGDPAVAGSNAVGPWLGDMATVYSLRGEYASAGDYMYESILHPNAVISPDCPTGACTEPSSMPGNFGERLQSTQEMSDIIEYILNR